MKKIFSCFLSMLVFCLTAVPGWCQTAFAGNVTNNIVRYPVTVDADTVKGGICWFSYYLKYSSDELELLYVESNEELFNNNASPAISAGQDGNYLITLYRTGEQTQSAVNLMDVNGVVAQGCVDYIDASATSPVIVAYVYFAVENETAINAVSFEASEKGGAVRAGTNSGVEPVILGAEGTGTIAPTVKLMESGSTVSDITAALDDPDQTFQSGSDGEILKAVLKHTSLTVSLEDGSSKVFDLADSELALGTDYQAVYAPPAEGSNQGIITFTFWGKNIPVQVFVNQYQYGDVNQNGYVNIQDALLLARAIRNGTESQYADLGDYNLNGYVNIQDALLLARDIRNGVV